MSDAPWLTIIGVGEDGRAGLGAASQSALDSADVVMGPERHLDLIGDTKAKRIVWPVPFADGLETLLSLRPQKVVVLASGDPFWFGAGSTISRHLSEHEWMAIPNISTFAGVASRLGWALESTACLGLHAAPLQRLRPMLSQGSKSIVLLRDGKAVADLANLLTTLGFGASLLHSFEALGGGRERRTDFRANAVPDTTFAHPVCIALTCEGDGSPIPKSSGIADEFFKTDGTMTKRPVRALTLSALAPKPGEHLWDLGSGSGSIAIEWLLSDPSTSATAVELRAERVQLSNENALALGVDRLKTVQGEIEASLESLPPPDAVFIGGGLSETLLERLFDVLPSGVRLVVNAVTLEAEALLSIWHTQKGGRLMRIELARAEPLGSKRGWRASYPIVQWSVTT